MKKKLFCSTTEKQTSFLIELKEILVRYNAEITIEDFGSDWSENNKIVVNFDYDESFFEKEKTGIIPQLILGTFENGK